MFPACFYDTPNGKAHFQYNTVAHNNSTFTSSITLSVTLHVTTCFQHLTATRARDVSDFVTTVTDYVTVAQSYKNFDPAIVSAITENILLHVFST